MKVLVDTHVLLWWLSGDDALSGSHREILTDGSNKIFVSSVTVAEISIKRSVGKLTVPEGIASAILDAGFDELLFTFGHAELLRALPFHHRDPFDRMLIAQCQAEALKFATVDPRMAPYDLSVV
ncbi:type II toxin-antitoxin system VapC family toxin [Nakamurella antarctica]|uniref:Type II toxin-antitoxin system VapC family toxin n=1 Tax=Nakamurella antarctica TaxID=1902245 RepID=A0A3G8ZKV3_9ACTN|nr:type II toxin-antitoxin system VapC family toxin [Nakamurella antarctica]AZI57475.1 type II toxin-antitoxin system VapC family toxin [Nakamurella antarctica]